MVTMAEVWDRTVAVARARWQALAAIALLLIWLPGVVQRGVQLALAGPASGGGTVAAGPMAAVALVGIATTLLALFGALAIVALASDPALAPRDALRVGLRRLPPMLGLTLLLGLVLLLLTVPLVLVVPGIAAMQAGSAPALSPSASAFVRWYSVALAVLLVWAQARLMLLSPVVVNERQGLASVVRSVRLTAGLTWRLVGVLLLLAIVAGVSVIAVRSVIGVVAALLAGDQPATVQFVAVAAASLVAVGWGTLAAIFAAQLYLVRTGGMAAPLAAPAAAPAPAADPGRPASGRTGPWG